jgi:hypothetical protein
MILHFRTRTRSETLPWWELLMDQADVFTKLVSKKGVSKNFNQFAHAAENIRGHKLKFSPLISVQKFSAALSSLRWFACRNFQHLEVLSAGFRAQIFGKVSVRRGHGLCVGKGSHHCGGWVEFNV